MNILHIKGSVPETDKFGKKIFFNKGLKHDILKKYGDNIYTPEVLWYSDPNLFNTIIKTIENKKIDIIIGSSAGGYMSYYLSNYYKLPSLMFNPAVAETSEAPVIQPVPQYIKNSDPYNKQMVIVGNRDLKIRGGVDFNLVINFFKSNNFFNVKTNKMYIESGMSHGVPNNIFEKYFDKFYHLYF
jgi:hypothetical protein